MQQGIMPMALLSLLLAIAMASVICLEVWFERLWAPYQWLTRARYPRGFPLIVGFHVVIFLALILLSVVSALAGW